MIMNNKVFEPNMSDRIRMVMALRNINPAQLAREIGMSQTAIRSICQGDCNPRSDTLTMICRKLDVSADYLLGLKEDMQ